MDSIKRSQTVSLMDDGASGRGDAGGRTSREAGTAPDDEDGVVEVPPPKRPRGKKDDAVNDEVVITGQSGCIATRDLPHYRSSCGHSLTPFEKCSRAQAMHTCTHCYCFPCDRPAGECIDWHSHCTALCTDYWKAVREHIKSIDSNDLKHFGGQWILERLARRERKADMDAPLKVDTLHTFQKQTLAWAYDNEENGAEVFIPDNGVRVRFAVRGGIIADEMGMGKTGTVVALMTLRKVFSLVVVPPNLVRQWASEIQKFSTLRMQILYGSSQKQTIEMVNNSLIDVVVVGAGSNIDQSIWKNVQRLIVDEGHMLLMNCKSSGEVMKKVRYESSNIAYKWILTGTPWVNYHSDRVVNNYFKILRIPKPDMFDDLCKVVMRHTNEQRMTHENATLSIPELKQHQIRVSLTTSELRLYEIATYIDYVSKNLKRDNLRSIFEHRILVANGNFDKFRAKVDEFFSRLLIPIGNSHEWITKALNLRAELAAHFANVSNGRISKFEQIREDMKVKKDTDSKFKAVIVTETPEEVGEWMTKNSNMNVVVAPTLKGKIKTKTHCAVEEFQRGMSDVFVCPVSVAEVGVNLQMANTLYFIDPDFDSTRYKQLTGRIRRTGCVHTTLHVVMVVVDKTVHETIYTYMTQRNNINLYREINERSEDSYETKKFTIVWDLCPFRRCAAGFKWFPQSDMLSFKVCSGAHPFEDLGTGTFSGRRCRFGMSDIFGNSSGAMADDDDDNVSIEHVEFRMKIAKPVDFDQIEVIVIRCKYINMFDCNQHVFVSIPFKTSSAVQTPDKNKMEFIANFALDIVSGISDFVHSCMPEDRQYHSLPIESLSVRYKSNPEKMRPYRFERSFLELEVRECKHTLVRTLQNARFLFLDGTPWWHDRYKVFLTNNKLSVTVHDSKSDDPTPEIYWATVPSITDNTVTEPNSDLKPQMRFHADVKLDSVDVFYEKVCPESYANIAVQLPYKMPVGSVVEFRVFDRLFKSRVLHNLTKDGKIFYCRIPSAYVGGQGRQSTNNLLLTEDCWACQMTDETP